jgi:phosphatidylinositol alpha-1,6-mannosyltransferase
MQNLSESPPLSLRVKPSPDILVICRTFLPEVGGIQEYAYNRCLQDPERIIVLAAACPGDAEFDLAQPFTIYRWFNPPLLQKMGILGSLLKQVLAMVCSFGIALYLYRRYRYRAIEWSHAYDFPALLLLSYLLPVQSLFIYLHGNDLLCALQQPLVRSLFAWTLGRLQGVICNSAFTQEYLQTHLSVPRPIYIIHPSVRPEKFALDKLLELDEGGLNSVRQHHHISETAIVILSVGRLIRRKGFQRLIAQLPTLLALDIDVHLILCGRGPMESELRELADLLQVSDRVHFPGRVEDAALARYYAAADLFAMLTFFDTDASCIEGFGIVYLEAGYFGKPVVASRVGGVSDAVLHEENGLLVDPDSPEEITAALSRLCRDPALRERLGRRGRELAIRITPHRCIYDSENS